MDKVIVKIRLEPLEELIEDVFKLKEEDLDLHYLGRLLDEYKELGGNLNKYNNRFIDKLKI